MKLQEVFKEAILELTKGESLVVATVVRTKGSTPQKPGAKLLVRSDGSGVGTLGGGCVEGDIWFAAKELMRKSGGPEHRDYELNEDIAAQDGLVCGGTMYFLIDPIYRPGDYLKFAEEIQNAYQGGSAVALASLTKAVVDNDNTAEIGSKLLIREDGTTSGSLGDPDLDLDAAERSMDLMIHGNSEYVYADDGAEFFIEAYTTPPQLVLVGAGHVSKAISPMAKTLGFRIFVVDDRKEFANEGRFPEADIIIVNRPVQAFKELPINLNSFIIIATRGHRHDNVALEAAVRTDARYVGLLGSKRKTILIYEDLIRFGIPIGRVREIRSPIGLDINARTPEEISVSIMSEILMFKLGGTGLPKKLEERLIEKASEKAKTSLV